MARRERDLERFLTFIDAIVAIAITLLVLPLVDLAGSIGDRSVGDLLVDQQAQIFGFLLSFAVIAQLWLAHHSITSGLVRQNRLVVSLTLIWVLTIVFLPFPTALVAEAPEGATTKVLYLGTMGASSATLAATAWTIARDPGLSDVDRRPDPLVAVVTTLAFLVALAVSLVAPATGYWPLLLLLFTAPIVRLLRGRSSRSAGPHGRG